MAQNILTKEPIPDHFAITLNGLIEYKGLIYMSSKCVQDQLLHDYYDTLTGGYQGIDRMYR